MLKRKLLLPVAIVSALASQNVIADVDPSLPDYQKVSGISGNVISVGSDTLANLMTLWAEEFKRNYPNVNIQIQAAGSSTAPTALTEGTANAGPMSRMMKSKEEATFEEKWGYKPTPIAVAIDSLAVYVNRDNPIKGLTIPQVDAIFSSTRKCGYENDITSWGQAGVGGSLEDKSIQIYGRNSVSGTYGYYKEKALCKGDYKSSVNEQPGSASVVQSVSTSLNSIGYSGIGYKTAGVKGVPLSRGEGMPFVEATNENALNGTYPLSRLLYVYVNKAPNQAMDPVVTEFFKLVLSRIGQQVVEKDGYIPLPANIAAKELAKFN